MKLFSKERISAFNIHYDHFTLDYFLSCQEKLGIHHVELLSGGQSLYHDPYGHTDPAPVRRMLEDHGISCICISPNNCGYQYQFAHADPTMREKSFEYFKTGMALGAELGSHLMQANSGWGFWNGNKEEGLKRSAEMHRRLAELGDEYDVTIACEALRPQESLIGYNVYDIKRLFDMVDHPRFKVMIDITAMTVCHETIQQWFDVFGSENIVHSHFQDSNPYGHLIWGTGTNDLGQFLKVFYDNNYQGYFSQELTVMDYFMDPFRYDRPNIYTLDQYFSKESSDERGFAPMPM